MYTLEPHPADAVLTSTHNLCFDAKITKIGIHLYTAVLLYKKWGIRVNITRTCFPDVLAKETKVLEHVTLQSKMFLSLSNIQGLQK